MKFKCWIEGYDDAETASTVEAFLDCDAAEEYVEKYHDNSGEYPAETKAHVIHPEGHETVFTVTWEATRVYYSEQL